jgi:hypothetical protein
MQRRGGIEAETSKRKRGLHQHFPTDVSKSSQLHRTGIYRRRGEEAAERSRDYIWGEKAALEIEK